MRTRPALLLLVLAICFGGLLTACGEDEQAVRVDLSRRAAPAPAAPEKGLTYAYLPQYDHTISYQRHRLLVEYLSNVLGEPVRQVFPDTFDEHVSMVRRGEIDISFSNPLVYLELAASGARAFAGVQEPDGSAFFRGQIIGRSDNAELKTLEDCRGKRWIAVDPSSAGGFLFPLGEFYEHGLTLGDFADIDFAPGPGGKQEKVVLAVYAGKYDIGSIRRGTLDVLAGKIDLDRIRVLAETRAYPGWVYAARRGLDPATAAKIAEALFALSMDNPEDAVILETARIRGIIPAEDADYDPVRALAAKLGLDPEEK